MNAERCETCGAVAVAWAMARGYCGPCWLDTFADDDDATLCGSCSDDMGDTFDAWTDADDIAPADRIPCGRCGC